MGDTDYNPEMTGKKIFFLCPTVVVQNKVITELSQQEYEVYTTKNKETLKRVLRKYPDSVVFIDINEDMAEPEWELWIDGLIEAPDLKVFVGIVTANEDVQIRNKYLLAKKLPCGYTILKFDLDKAITHIVKVLQAIDAKGRRKYIRATTEREASNITLNMSVNGTFVNGIIRDISVVGISCTLEGSPEIPKNTLFKDIQVKLQSSLLKVEGIIFGSRMEGEETIYVLLFTQRIDPEVRTKIRKYIQQNLQKKMDYELR